MNTELSNIFDNASVGTGCAVSSTKRWAMSVGMTNNVDTMNSFKVHSNTNCLYMLHPSTGVIMYSADFSAWITDGFRLNWTDAPTPNNLVFSYLVINGGTWDCGNFTSPTTPTNNVDTAVSVSSKPIRGLLINSVSASAYDSILSDAVFAIGATDGTNTSSIGIIDEDNQAISDSYRINNTTNIIRALTANGAALDTATFDSFTTNNFRLDYSAAAAGTKTYGWVVVAGEITTQNYTADINTEPSVSISETLTRIQNRIFTINESTISVNQTLARIQSLIKTIADPTISISEALTKSKTFVNTITDSAITVSETISRIQNRIKTIAESAVSTSETLTKVVSYIKAIGTEPSVSVGQTLFAVKAFVKSITTETAISVSDTIQKLLAATRPITGVTTTTSDSIIKIQSLIKQISESTISVSDSLQGSLLYIISVIESRIKWYYSLLTRKN